MNSYMKQMEESSKQVASLNQQISSATNHESQLRQQLKTDRKKNQDLKQNNAGKNKIEPINNHVYNHRWHHWIFHWPVFFLLLYIFFQIYHYSFSFIAQTWKQKQKRFRIKIIKINNKLTFNPFTQYIQTQHHISTWTDRPSKNNFKSQPIEIDHRHYQTSTCQRNKNENWSRRQNGTFSY